MKKGHGSKLNRKMELAIAALLTHRSVEEAARDIGVGYNTLLRWMKLPKFKAAYREARRTVVSQAIARLQQASTAAATTITKLTVDPKVREAVRLQAAIYLLKFATGAEWEDMEARLAEVEQILKGQKQGW